MRLLVLAGCSDSFQIAGALAKEHRIAATASVARPTRSPVPLGIPTRIGGWPSQDALEDWLKQEKVEAILDATHPFATRIRTLAWAAARSLGLDYLQFQRPQWMPGSDDRWTFVNGGAEVHRHVPEGARVLIDTEGRGVTEFGAMLGRVVYLRLRDPEPGKRPTLGWTLLYSRGPFGAETETQIYRQLRIDWLVLQNVGGVDELGKLEAARRSGVKLAMIRRPPQSEAPRVTSISEVMRWVRRRL